jgi:TolB protein
VTSDGHHVVFTSDRAGIPHIWRVDTEGTNPEQLTNGQGEEQADCSPDGKWLVYTAPDKGWTLWKVASPAGHAERHPVQLNQSVSAAPSISPDGKMIAFNYNASPKAGTAVIPFEGGPPIILIGFEMPVHWTSDGRAVLYVSDPGSVANIWSQPIAGGRPKRLTDFKSEEIYGFDWSRDGKQLAVVRAAHNYDAVLIRDLE